MRCCNSSKLALTLAAGLAGGFMIQATLAPTIAIQPEGMDSESFDQVMEEMMKLGQPSEHHEKLGRTIGDWNVKSSFMTPDGTEIASDGSMSCEWALGGRYVQTDFHLDDMMGQPFTGIGYNGYDNAEQSYFGIWMDSTSTRAFVMEGEFNEDGSYTAIGDNGMGGKMKIVSQMTDDNTITDTFYDSMPDGSWGQSGTMTYTRK